MNDQVEKQKLIVLTMSDIQNKLWTDLDIKHLENGVCLQVIQLNGQAFP